MSNEAGIFLRRKFESARRRIFPAVFMIALGAPPASLMEQAQAQNSESQVEIVRNLRLDTSMLGHFGWFCRPTVAFRATGAFRKRP